MRPAAGTPHRGCAHVARLVLALVGALLAVPAQALAIGTPQSPTAPTPTRVKPVLTWAAPSDPGLGIAGYNVYRGVTRLTVVPTTALTYTDTGATANTTLSYTVRTVETGTGLESAASTAVPVVYDTTVPPAPTGLASAAAITNLKPALTWAHAGTDNLSGLAGFRILRAGVLVTSVASSARSFTDTGLAQTGSVQYQVKAYDNAGNESTAASTTVIYDNVPPGAPSSFSPIAAQRVFPVITWGAATDTGGAGILRYDISRNGSVIGQATTTTFTDATLPGQGTYAYTVVAIDKAGNTGSPTPSRNVTYDIAAPTAPTALASTGSPTKLKPSLSWTGSTDALSGVTGYRVYRGATLAGTANGTVFTDTALGTDGTYAYTVAAVDAAGNESAASSATSVVYDKTAPPKPEALAGTSPTSAKPVLTWSSGGGDALSGFSHYEIWRGTTLAGTTTGTTFTDAALSTSGVQSYTVKAVDLAGNQSVASTARSIIYDVIAPGAPSSLTVPVGTNAPPTLSWASVTDTGGSGTAGYRIYRDGTLIGTSGTTAYTDVAAPANVQYAYAVAAIDNAGNEGQKVGPKNVWYDTVAPTAAGTPTGTTPTRAKPVLTWTAGTDGGSGIAQYVILANGVQAGTSTTTSFTHTALSANGTYTYEVQVVDRAGNVSALSGGAVIAYDSTAPSQPGSLAGTTPTASAPVLTWTASSDALSGLARYDVYRGQTLAGSVTPPATTFTDSALAAAGTYAYTVKAVDLAGNVSTPSLARTIVFDPVAPSAPGNLGGTSPTSRPVVTWSAVTDTSGIVRYDVYRDGDLVGSSGNTSYTDASLTTEGVVGYAIRAIDGAGNVSPLSATRSFTVDLTAPPVPGSLSGATPSAVKPVLSWTSGGADTGSGFKEFRVYRNGTQVGTSTNGTYTDSALTVNGAFRYAVSAVDVAGNESAQSAETTVEYDSTAPPLPTGLAAASPTNSAPSLTWFSGGPDNVSGLSHYNVYRNGVRVNAAPIVATSFTDGTTPGDGAFQYTVKAVDLAGNESGASAQRTVLLDRAVPTSPAPVVATSPTRSSPQLSWPAASDGSGSGIVGYAVYRDETLLDTTTSRTYTDDEPIGDGVYAYVVRAIDAAGNTSAATPAVSVRLDREAPPAPTGVGGTTPTNQPSLTWTSSSDSSTGGSGVVGYRVYRDGLLAGASGTPAFVDATVTTSDAYVYTVRAVDGAGNESADSSPVGIDFDNVPPPVPGTPTAPTPSTLKPSLSWTCGCSSPTGDLALYEILRNGVVVGTAGGTSFADATLGANGSYTYTVRAVDLAGNRSAASSTRTVVWDTTAPGAAQSLTGATPSAEPRLAWSAATDAGGAGIARYDILRDGLVIGTTTATSYVDATLPDEGAHAYTVVAIDGAGNAAEPSAPATIDVDRTPPTPPGLLDGTTPSPRPQLTWGAAADPGATASGVAGYRVYRGGALVATVEGASYRDDAILPQGSHTYVVRAIDRAGNASAPTDPRAILLDSAPPPQPTGLGATTPTRTAPSISWRSGGADNLSGFDRYEVLRDGELVAETTSPAYLDADLAVEGVHDYRVRAVDVAGNRSAPSSVLTAIYDPVPPPPPVGFAVDTPTRLPHLVWDAVDDDDTGASGVARYAVYRDGQLVGTSTTTSFDDGTVPAPGSYGYQVRAVDAAGNEGLASATRTVRFDDQAPDAPPSLEGRSPVRMALLSWQPASDADAGGSAIARYRVFRDGIFVGDSTGLSFTDTTPVESGVHVYTVRAVDAAGNSSPTSPPRQVTIDADGPALGSLVFPRQAIAGKAVRFAVEPRDTFSALAGEARWDFGVGTANGNTVTYTFHEPGTFAVVVRAEDVLGNTTAVANRTIRILTPRGGLAPGTLKLTRIVNLSLRRLARTRFRFGAFVTSDVPTTLDVLLMRGGLLVSQREVRVIAGGQPVTIQIPKGERVRGRWVLILRHAVSGKEARRTFVIGR